MLRLLPSLLVLALWIYAFIDCLTTPEKEVRHLPKVVWIIIVLLFGTVLLGPIAWLVAGKVRKGPRGEATLVERHRDRDRGPVRYVAPDDNPEFLKSLTEENRNRTGAGAGAKPGDGTEIEDEVEDKKDETVLRNWEADLRRREEELERREREGRREQGGPEDGTP
ncbi:PLD nuclease N-terminal domain-containing protein [Streptomyces minutiscleroticus]|uniref:Cardiolipin synthase N-terminal domain-containing protein n=1 Tax=Streptomyces minutiscleroticus TaxID=68238 RepID=A0A918NEY9_9ACTN|nr:PLD nuclease N-terminal domain-containing protein [Streptomyces minutiscleroticus]GGX62861.1 hypothetical protein GCM10010358_16560 [Streptomyces minutiscleroticus]